MAITFDASTSGTGGTGSPQTWSHTCTGSDRILLVSIFSQGTVSAVTYNGVSMTSLGSYNYTSPTGNGTLWYLIAPATGSNTVSITHSGSYTIGVASSYTGVKQTGQPDAAINTQTTGGSTGTALTSTVTVVASGSWLVTGTVTEGAALTAGTGAYLRQVGSNAAVALFDSNGAPGTGSQSMTINESPTNRFAIGMVSIAPVVSATANSAFFAFM